MAWSDAGLVDVLEVTERSTMKATALAAVKTSHWSRILIIQSGTCGKMATIIDVRTTELCLFATRLAMDPNGKVGGEDSKTGFQVALVLVKPVPWRFHILHEIRNIRIHPSYFVKHKTMQTICKQHAKDCQPLIVANLA